MESLGDAKATCVSDSACTVCTIRTCSYICTYLSMYVCMYVYPGVFSLSLLVCECAYIHTYICTYSMYLFLLPSLPPLCTASHANPPSPALWCHLSYGTLGQHSLQCLWGHHQTVGHGQFQNKAGTYTHIHCLYKIQRFWVCSRHVVYIYSTCVYTYVCTHVLTYMCKLLVQID